jgi:hypothetical protein
MISLALIQTEPVAPLFFVLQIAKFCEEQFVDALQCRRHLKIRALCYIVDLF